MRFAGIVRFELAYQVRRPWPWLMFGALLVVSFLMTRDAAVQDALFDEFYVNAPFSIAVTPVVGGLLWLLLAPVVAGEAAARDVAVGMHPLTYTSSVGRVEYLGGRFVAALLLNAGLLLAIQIGALLAIYSPGVNPQLIAPFRAASYLTAYAYLSLPNAIVATVIQFAIALRAGRPMAGYVGSIFLIFMGVFVASLLLFKRGLGVYLDPVGIRFVVEDIAHLWTTAEKSHRLLSLEGIVLQNRAVWLAVATLVGVLTLLTFRFAHRTQGGWVPRLRRAGRGEHSPTPARLGVSARVPVELPSVARTFGLRTDVRRTLAIARASFLAIARGWLGLGFFVGIPLLTIVVLLDQMFSFGSPLIPSTGQVLQELTGPITSELSRWIIVPLLTVFFAGELVWREREAGLDEIADASPVREWIPLLGKLLGLLLLLGTFLGLLMGAGIATQLIMGHHDFDVGLYVAVLFGLQLTEFMLFAVLALVVHVIAGQKYVGHIVAILLYVMILLAPTFGIEHNMLTYGSGPWWTFTDMRGLGPFIAPWLWFKLYWGAWALLLLIAARLLWVRGRESGSRVRLSLALRRLTGATARAAALGLALVVLFGGFVFYNTNVLNDYVPAAELERRQAEYERRYGAFARAAQPHIARARLNIDIHPTQRAVAVRGEYELLNHTATTIDSIHVATLPIYDVRALSFDRGATRVVHDDRLGHHVYRLDAPLQPGESVRMRFEVDVVRRGFREGGADVSIVPNGTLFTQYWMPMIGYQRTRELMLPSDRREHGLPQRRVIPSLYDEAARHERTPGLVLETTMSTEAGQTAVAPGRLRRSWTEGDRSFFEYATDAPIGTTWSFASARYAMREASWNDVTITVFHHPEHATHPGRMIRGIQESLEFLSARIAPYPHGHITVLEVPGDGVGMHAEAGLLTHGEGITMLDVDASRLDMPYAVMAHEMAHQWALPIAVVEGAPVLAEGFAWYYAIQQFEQAKGADETRRLMAFLRNPHPIAPIHRGEPLLRGLDPWMSYRKTPYALVALSEYVGRDTVLGAMRRLYEIHDPNDAPLATTLDLYRELQAVTPESMRRLLHDLFEVNAVWQFRLERAQAVPLPSGEWQVTLDLHARKMIVDSTGAETDVGIAEPIQVGVFGAAEAGRGELSGQLYLGMHRLVPGDQTITVTVPARPVFAGVDPLHLLDWEENEDDDNIEQVEIPESAE